MLHLILGRAGYGKTAYLHRLLVTLAREGKHRLILMVPEQASFSSEKAILQQLSPRLAQQVEVLSFSRLAEDVLQQEGLLSAGRIDKGGRAMLMSQAVDQLQQELMLYRKAARNPLFAEKMLSTVTELKLCGISPQQLRDFAGETDKEVTAQKLRETALLMEGYQALLGERFSDEQDDLTRFDHYLRHHRYFENAVVMLDSFSGFTHQEMGIVEHMLCQAEGLYVALTADRLAEKGEGLDVFAIPKQTANQLLALADRHRVPKAAPLRLTTPHRFSSPDLLALEEGFLNLDAQVYEEPPAALQLTLCDNLYDECDAIARRIKGLLREEGLRCRDIAVVARDIESFLPVMRWTLQKYEIPVFEDQRQPVSYQPLIKMIGYALEVVNHSFQTEDVLRYAKCGLTSLSAKGIALLDQYATLWQISGSGWKKEFYLHPRGFQRETTQEDRRLLKKLNQLRKRLIDPLETFRQQLQEGGDGPHIAGAMFRLLQNARVQPQLRKLARTLDRDGEPALAEELGRVWDLTMELLDQIALLFEGDVLTSKRFVALFRVLIDAQDLGSIPQGMDEVTIGGADRVRLDNPKVVFLAGANEGVFPANPSETGVLNFADRDRMAEGGLEISNTYQQRLQLEYYAAYCALTGGSQRLYVSFRKEGQGGEVLPPSLLVSELRRIFPQLQTRESGKDLPMEHMEGQLPAFEWMASHWREGDAFVSTLRDYFSRSPLWKGRYEAVRKAAENLPLTFQSGETATRLFGSDLRLSASRVEDFYQCPFRYFCKFGMKAYPQTVAELNPMHTGTIIHYVLEHLVREYGGKGLSQLPRPRLYALVNELLEEYLQEAMGGQEEKSARFLHLFRRLAATLVTVVEQLARELAQSEFEPIDFELRVNYDSDIQPLELTASDGSKVSVLGVVDRVDVMKKAGKTYLRVIDYKSGSKVFDLQEVLLGLNMQMMIYLFTIWENGREKYGDIVPAGVLYMPAVLPYVSLERTASPEKLEGEKQKALRMNGLVLNDPAVITGMEKDVRGIYIPVSIKKNEMVGSLIGMEELGALQKKIDDLLLNIAQTLHQGEIAPKPYRSKNKNACEYCDYQSVCRFQKH